MALSPKTVYVYDLDGSNRTFPVNFEYLTRRFVQVTLIGQDRKLLVLNQDYRFTGKTSIQTTLAWGAAQGYERIEIRRFTSATERLVDFTDGSILRAYDLNVANVQGLHIAEEARDLTADTIAVNNDGDLDARGRRIVNLADATEPDHAVTLRQEQEWAESTFGNATASKNSADISAAEALKSKGQADESTAQAMLAAGAARRAADSETASGVASVLAEAWASKAEDILVVGDKYSSLHYASKSSKSAVAAKGSQDAAKLSETASKGSADKAKTEADRARDEASKVDTARMRPMVITPEEINSGWAAGGPMTMKNGGYYQTEGAVINYKDTVGFAGHPSNRQSVQGEVQGGTIISVQHSGWAFQSLGPAPFTQATGGQDSFGNFTIVGPNVTAPNGSIGDGKGLKISNRANTHIHDMLMMNLEQGFHLDGVLTSSVERVNVSGCAKPSIINTSDETSAPNAMSMRNLRIANHKTAGIVAECGAAASWENFTGEGNGTWDNGDVVLSMTSSYEPFAGITRFTSPYFELNAGAADMYFENKTSAPMVIVIDGGLFARVSDRFVSSHIIANASGSGTIDVFVKNPVFIEGFGYQASAARPMTRSLNSRSRIHLINPQYFIGEATSVPLSASASATFVMHMEPTGDLYTHAGWTSRRTPGGSAAGDWIIERNTPIARNVWSYLTVITPSTHVSYPDTGDNVQFRSRRLTEKSFRVRTFNTAGVGVDTGLDIAIHTMN